MDFVLLDGRLYLRGYTGFGDLTERHIGRPFTKTRCKLDEVVTDGSYRSRDGDAAFLEPGTRLFRVRGYSPMFRLAARVDGEWALYEVDDVDGATIGGDVMDIEGMVSHITLNRDPFGPRRQFGIIEDGGTIRRLVEMVVTAPVDQSREIPPGEDKDSFYVIFHLEDGTVTSRLLWPRSRVLSRGILVPERFVNLIERWRN